MAFLKKLIRSFTKIFGLKASSPRRTLLKAHKSRIIKSSKKSRIKTQKKVATKPRIKTTSSKKSNAKQKPAKAQEKLPKELLVGEITHYFPKIQVVVLKTTSGVVNVGDHIHIQGQSTNFVQKIKSLQIESIDVKSVKKGQLAGLKVDKEAKVGDKVFLAKMS
jgi:hypothetical protein